MFQKTSLTMAICLALFICAGAALAGDISGSAIFIDEPGALTPSTQYDFEFRVFYTSDNNMEWLYSFTATFPNGYYGFVATAPEAVSESGTWRTEINGQSVRFYFYHSQSQGQPWGDVHPNREIVFKVKATTNAEGTNRFVCALTADEGGSMNRTRYVGAPEVTSFYPSDRRLADRDEPFEIEFASAVDTSTFNYDIDPDLDDVSVEWSDGNKKVTISHEQLSRNKSYTLEMKSAANVEGFTANPVQATFYVKSEDYDSAFTPSPPVCDGVLVPGEWDNAEVYEIGIDDKEINLYLMNDVGRFYMAIDAVSDKTLSSNDQFFMYFDEDGDGKYPEEEAEPSEEGIYWLIFFEGDIIVNYRGLWGNYFGDGLYRNDDIETSRGVSAGVNLNVNVGNVQFEFCPSIVDSFLNPMPGGTMGILLAVSNWIGTPQSGEFQSMGQTPKAAFSSNPETFRTINLAEAQAPAVMTIEPDHGQTNLTTEVVINGLYFDENAVAYIGEYELVAPSVEGGSKISGLVKSSLPVECYDVIVQNPDGQEGVLENGFAICDADGNCPDCGPEEDDDDDTDAGDDDDDDDDACGC